MNSIDIEERSEEKVSTPQPRHPAHFHHDHPEMCDHPRVHGGIHGQGRPDGRVVHSKSEDVRDNLFLLGIAAGLIAAVLGSLMIGRYLVSVPDFFAALLARFTGLPGPDTVVDNILWNVRLPRIAAAVIIGAALGASGATYQGLFRNPLVSPDILGASAGAGFGASLAILFSMSLMGIQLMAFGFGLGAVLMVIAINAVISRGHSATLGLILTGIVVGTMFTSFTSLIKYVADPEQKLPSITFWLMGGLSTVKPADLWIALIPIAAGIVPIALFRWKLNVLAFGDDEARALGIDAGKMRIVFVICSTLLTAAAVSMCGMVGWIGLIIPHIARMITGPNYLKLLPSAMILGGGFLLLVDNVARSAFQVEIPLGILTSLIGAPFFVYLLMKGRRGWL
ncbi:MAG: FecCD family ABC transporter permease [Chitinispirillaceae bacterium]